MKKLIPIVSASVVTGLALLSFAACSSPASSDDNMPDTTISASATPSSSPTATSTSKPKASPQATTDGPASEVRVSPPTELKIADVTTNSMKASWVAPTNTVGKITHYTILLKENGAETETYETSETDYAFTGLKSNTAYMVEVRTVAVSDNGVSEDVSEAATSNTVVVRSSFAAESPVQSSTPTASPSPSISTNVETGKVASALTEFYKFVGSPDSLAKVKEAGKDYESNRTDAELKKMVTDFPEGFKYFDTSSSKNISDAYNQLVARTTQSNRTGSTVTVTVPVEAVIAKDGKATIDSTKLKVESKGKTSAGTEAPYFENAQLNLVKSADGSWVLIPEPPRHTIP